MADNDIDPDIDLNPPTNQPADNSDDDEDSVDPDVTASADTDDDSDDDEDGQGRSAPELIDYDLGDGRKVKVPAEVKDHLLRQSDYTRKTQTIAEKTKELEAERAALTALHSGSSEVMAARGELALVEKQLTQWDQVTPEKWAEWQNSQDPNVRAKAQTSLQQMQLLERRRASLTRAVDEAKQKHESETQQQTAKRLEATRAFAEREIPGWTDREKEIGTLLSDGIKIGDSTRKALGDNLSPDLIRILDLALDGHKYRDARAKKAKSPKPESNVTPLNTVGSRRGAPSTMPRDPSKMTMDQYVAWRKGRTKKAS